MNGSATYRLVFAQPDPENGEKVCVGLLFVEDTKASLLFDEGLSKVRCVAPRYDLKLLKYYLGSLRSAIGESSRHDLDITLSRYSPHVLTSDARRVAAPVSAELKHRLLERYATSENDIKLQVDQLKATPLETIQDAQIGVFVEKFTTTMRLKVLRDVSPDHFFPKMKGSTGRIRPVAAAVVTPGHVVLIDGVDLSRLTPKRGLARTNRVVQTFWQSRRLETDANDLAFPKLQRVGVVLNGAIQKSDAYFEAHDYAIHQFKKEADLTVDAESYDDQNKFQQLLRDVGHEAL